MGENKDNKTPKRRGFVATVIGNKKSASNGKENVEDASPINDNKKQDDAKRKQRDILKRKRASDERKRKAAREERERLAAEKTQKAKEKALKEKTAKDRKEAEKNLQFSEFTTESGSYETTLNKMYLNRKSWEEADPKHILSFMPGTVEEIMVKKGEEVKVGDVLMIFRAMKMNNRMVSPVDGKVKAINVAQGENVPKDTLMIELS